MDDNSQTDRRRLPILDLTVQLALVRINAAIGTRANHFFPRLCIWVDAERGLVLDAHLLEPVVDSDYIPAIIERLNTIIPRIGGAPRQIQMRDARLARELRHALEPYRIEVVVRESLPQLDQAMEGMQAMPVFGGRQKKQPALLDQPGMTLDRVIAFAEAAQLFYDAMPWRHLIDDDLIEIHSPSGPKGTRYTQVLGAGGNTFGLGFVETRQQHAAIRNNGGLPRGAIWSMLFDNIDGLPFEDGELWERHNLPLADDDAYPAFGRYTKSKGFAHPDADQLAFAEGLLRALAATTEDQIDAGRWEKQVQTSVGPMNFILSLPILLEEMSGKSATGAPVDPRSMPAQMESMMRALHQQIGSSGARTPAEINALMKNLSRSKVPDFVPTTPAERAQALCYQAQAARGRRQVQLARQALAIDSDCADAILILAGRAGQADEAIRLYERAMHAAERSLGDEIFESGVGHFWGIIETRPYMRARQALAIELLNDDRFDEAASHFMELLRLNPGDNQGNRYPFAQALLHANRLDELDELLNKGEHRDDFSTEWKFTRLLLEFRRKGDSAQTRQRLAEAVQSNKFVVPILTGKMDPPPPTDAYRPGDISEATTCISRLAIAFAQTPGAMEWLEQTTRGDAARAAKW